jgi:hypothetical protein
MLSGIASASKSVGTRVNAGLGDLKNKINVGAGAGAGADEDMAIDGGGGTNKIAIATASAGTTPQPVEGSSTSREVSDEEAIQTAFARSKFEAERQEGPKGHGFR